MKTKNNLFLPVDIKLTEGVIFDDGTMFISLRTLDEFEQFWQEHKDKFEFACEGRGCENPIFLREYEWVFGTSKSAVIRKVMRWGESGVGCEFYDWAKNDPEEHSYFFIDREAHRQTEIEKGTWSDEDEVEYKADCIRRSPNTYRGYWQLKDIPGGIHHFDFLYAPTQEELIDPTMPIAEVEKTLQEQTFDALKWQNDDEIVCHDRESIEGEIAYWREEQTAGNDYYGEENEAAAVL